MKCSNCGSREAEYLLFEDGLIPLCGECLDEHARMFGEITMTYWPIEELVSKEGLKELIREVNRELKYWQKRYQNLLSEYIKLKGKSPYESAVNEDTFKSAIKPRKIPVKCLYCGRKMGEEEVLNPYINVLWSICDRCKALPYRRRVRGK